MSALEIVVLEVGGTVDAWRAAGFAVGDDATFVVGHVTFCVTGAAGGIARWRVRGIPSGADLDGLPTEVVDDVTRAQPTAHPNGAVLLDHVVVATPDCDRTIAAFRAVGCEPRRERTGGSAEHPLHQTFLRAGEVILEVVGPPAPPERAEHRARPATFWGLAFSVDDIDACAVLLGDALGAVRDAVQPGRRIATLRHDAVGLAVPIAVMSP